MRLHVKRDDLATGGISWPPDEEVKVVGSN